MLQKNKIGYIFPLVHIYLITFLSLSWLTLYHICDQYARYLKKIKWTIILHMKYPRNILATYTKYSDFLISN